MLRDKTKNKIRDFREVGGGFVQKSAILSVAPWVVPRSSVRLALAPSWTLLKALARRPPRSSQYGLQVRQWGLAANSLVRRPNGLIWRTSAELPRLLHGGLYLRAV